MKKKKIRLIYLDSKDLFKNNEKKTKNNKHNFHNNNFNVFYDYNQFK